MAKKKNAGGATRKRGRPRSDQPKTGFSLRFSADQRQLITEAAELKGQSPAEFVRDAALRRARDVVNAGGPIASGLEDLALAAARQLNGIGSVRLLYLRFPDEQDITSPRELTERLDEEEHVGQPSYRATKAQSFLQDRHDELNDALLTCGTEFVDVLSTCLAKVRADGPARYVARVTDLPK